MTLGSLFDGSGGFPLAGVLNGITPVWASEIEPYPIAVTRSRFPNMKHLGSVTEINGGEIEPVDIITFGSPCQDLSVAGKRAGIHDGARSSLFFQAIRIIEEMREATNGRYPRFAVWENVPGAFTSNQGEDFRCVLEAFCEVKDAGHPIPRPSGGKWAAAGEIVADGFSVAWRQLDAQYWGVPQRRKRIYLVADFAGQSAGKILFECNGLSGNTETSGEARKDSAGDVGNGIEGSNSLKCLNPHDGQRTRAYDANGVWTALSAAQGGNNQAVVYALDSTSSHSMMSDNPRSGFHAEQIARTLQAGGVDPTCNQGGNVIVQKCPAYTMTTGSFAYTEKDLSMPLCARDHKNMNLCCYAITGFAKYEEVQPTLRASGGDYGGGAVKQ